MMLPDVSKCSDLILLDNGINMISEFIIIIAFLLKLITVLRQMPCTDNIASIEVLGIVPFFYFILLIFIIIAGYDGI